MITNIYFNYVRDPFTWKVAGCQYGNQYTWCKDCEFQFGDGNCGLRKPKPKEDANAVPTSQNTEEQRRQKRKE